MDPQPGWNSAASILVEELTPTRVVAYVYIDERHQQPYGIVHGGVWASIVESVGSPRCGARRPRDHRPDGGGRNLELHRFPPHPPHWPSAGDRHTDLHRPNTAALACRNRERGRLQDGGTRATPTSELDGAAGSTKLKALNSQLPRSG